MSIFADAMATGDGATATNAEAIASLALPFLVDGNHDHPESMAANTGADDGRSMAIDEATYDKGTVVDAGAATTPGQAEPIVTSGEAVGSDEEATDDEATDDEATDDEATHQTITADEEVSDEVTGIDAEITAPAMASNDEAMAPCVGTIATEAKAMAFNQEATDDEPAVAGEETRDVATTAADTMATAAIAEATTADAMTADAEDMVAGEAAAEDTTPGGTTIRHPRTAKRKCIEALSPLCVDKRRKLFPFLKAIRGQVVDGEPGALVQWIPTPVRLSDAGDEKSRASIRAAPNQSLPTSSATYPNIGDSALAFAPTNTPFSHQGIIRVVRDGQYVVSANWDPTFVRVFDAGNSEAKLLIMEVLDRDCPGWDTKQPESSK